MGTRRPPKLIGRAASTSLEAELRRELRKMIASVRASLPTTVGEARALGVALRKAWPDKRVAAIVSRVGAAAESRASQPWRRFAPRGDSAVRMDAKIRGPGSRPSDTEFDDELRALADLDAIGRGDLPDRVFSKAAQIRRGKYIRFGPDGRVLGLTSSGRAAVAGAAEAAAIEQARAANKAAEAEARKAAAAERKARQAAAPRPARPTPSRATGPIDPAYDGAKLLDRWSREATARITSVRDEVAEAMRKDILAALREGTDPAELAAKWRAEGIPVLHGTLEGRMKVIAQHQLATLHSQVQRERAKSVGVTEFYWRTQGDDRVRDAHRALADTRHRYDDPPDEGLPGEPVNCRCWAESVIPDDLLGGLGVAGTIETT